MTAFCLDASLETLRPLCYHCTHRLQGKVCRCSQEGFLQTIQVLLMLSARPVLQNSPQFVVQRVEVWTPEGQPSALKNIGTCLRSHSWVVLALCAGAESFWKTHFWPLKRTVLIGFTTPFDTLGHQFSHLSRKNEAVSPRDGTTPQTMS